MKHKIALIMSAASLLLAGTAATSAAHRHYVHHYAPRSGYAYGPGNYGSSNYPWAFGPSSRRCANAYARYRTAPPGAIIQDRDFQEHVLGLPFC
jgi:hypothetical protein